MSINTKSKIIQQIARTLGDVLVFLRPKKARELSENRITLVHMNKKNLTTQERLMRYVLVNKLEKIQDHETIAKLNVDFWRNNKATELFVETEDLFETHFLPNCTFIFDLLKEELSSQSVEFNTLVEIGTGNGYVLNYLSSEFPKINRFVGIDLSEKQVEKNNKKFSSNKKLEFVASDALDWIKRHGQGNTIFVTRDVLEYFLEPNLQEFFNEINRLNKTIFIAIEPNGSDHNFETNPNSQLYGNEPSFSHNYPKLFKNAGFNLWHFSQKPVSKGGTQTFIGAKYSC
ncbi:methyltransferase domain-containing protein [Winogradskyella thalassocola]|uniref:Methyltransferase domain-containing protein n=1 Tax=Winogradskyella thalassocola TaxID=262004 RepID=A0A1G8LDB3_9FLAO|nr:methyltransferase domain-containing protein [Winogradskyella thalassocola]SDI53661.1 Methyltransferase domain-containing protein [Winogradskyella thalassocola]